MKKKVKLTKISLMHYFKLVFRSMLLLAATALYFIEGRIDTELFSNGIISFKSVVLCLIWVVFAVEMTLRFFPSRLESMGCQKQFSINHKATGEAPDREKMSTGVLTVFTSWIALNAIIAAVYYAGVIDSGILLLIALCYSVCDMICILFFCPFQTWMMKNKCCGSCRIYNWDFAMMFTPLLLVPNLYNWSLLAIALALLIKWEFMAARYPERFSERSNACLTCANCPEKLCSHKKQLQRYLKTYWENRKRGELLRQLEEQFLKGKKHHTGT